MTVESGYDDKQLLSIDGRCFVVRIYGEWKDGHFIEEKDFSPETRTSLLSHHADTLKTRLENIGG